MPSASALYDRRALPPGMIVDRWMAADGWAMRRFTWGPPAGTASRGHLLFQTGRADFLEKYLDIFDHFRGRGWTVTGFDWRGQGGSGTPPDGAPTPSLDTMVDDLAQFVGEWRTRGVGPHVAIGHSMGGHLLLRLLAERDMTLDAAVLVAPMLGLRSHPVPPRIAAAIAAAACRIGLGARPVWRPGQPDSPTGRGRQATLTSDLDRYSDEAWWMARHPAFFAHPPCWRWLDDAFRSTAALGVPGVLERVRTPVLIVGATRDRLVDPTAIVAAAARIPGAGLRMRDDGAHELLRERDAVRLAVLADIDAFLDGATRADATPA